MLLVHSFPCTGKDSVPLVGAFQGWKCIEWYTFLHPTVLTFPFSNYHHLRKGFASHLVCWALGLVILHRWCSLRLGKHNLGSVEYFPHPRRTGPCGIRKIPHQGQIAQLQRSETRLYGYFPSYQRFPPRNHKAEPTLLLCVDRVSSIP